MKRRFLSSSASSAAALRRQAIKRSGAPKSIGTILDEGFLHEQKNKDEIAAVIRPVGCTRRVFLLKPYLTSAELEGLAYRIRTLTKNEGLNSVLIATDDTDDAATGALPSLLLDRDYPYLRDESVDPGFPPFPGHSWHVASGYDPLTALYQTGHHRNNPEAVQTLLAHVADLALAMRGSARKTKIPTISIPHGKVHDAGFAVCFSSTYVLATRETSFSIRHPTAGLALDPVGLSFLLPRLGQEFKQPASKYIGCGLLLALTGYPANAADLMETGLATHYMETPTALGLLEHTLSEIPPWNQQGLLQTPVRFHGDPEPVSDHNAQFRNVAVADAVHCFSSYRADAADMYITDEQQYDAYFQQDASLELGDDAPWHEDRESNLVNYAATFDEIFTTETSVQGIYERFKEVAARQTNDPDEQEGIDVAQDICQRLERQSPLATSVMYALLRQGSKGTETLQSCMAREQMVQSKLLQMADFERWAQYAVSNNKSAADMHDDDDESPPFTGWKHKSFAEVTRDEIAELLELQEVPQQQQQQ